MAFPTLGTPGSDVETVSVTDHDIVLPTGRTTGKLLIMAISCDGSPVMTIPTGWTQLIQQSETTAVRCYVGYRYVDGAEDDDLIWESDVIEQHSCAVWEITGAHASTPPEAAAAVANDINPDAPSLNPTGWDVEDTLWLWICASDGVETVTAAPSGYSGLTNWGGGGGSSANLAVAWLNSAAASENPGTGTLAGAQNWVTATVAIPPEPSATLVFTQPLFPGLSRR